MPRIAPTLRNMPVQQPSFGMIALLLILCSSFTHSGLAAGLSTQQRLLASTLAHKTGWSPLTSAKGVDTHPLGRQVLFIEKREHKKSNAARYAGVYEFNYNHQSARLLVIDLDTAGIQSVQPLDTVHLPLNQAEISFAISLIKQDANLLQQLRDEQSQRGQTPFTSLTELDIKASIFEPMSHARLNEYNACGAQRCALISLFDKTRTVFSIEPIVNLSALQLRVLVH